MSSVLYSLTLKSSKYHNELIYSRFDRKCEIFMLCLYTGSRTITSEIISNKLYLILHFWNEKEIASKSSTSHVTYYLSFVTRDFPEFFDYIDFSYMYFLCIFQRTRSLAGDSVQHLTSPTLVQCVLSQHSPLSFP